jgi:hypothetical protein
MRLRNRTIHLRERHLSEVQRRAGGLCLESQFSSRRRELMHPAQVERFLQSFATPEGQARLSRDCSPRQPGGLEIATTRRIAASPAELTAAIHRALNSRQPAMINFASSVLSGPSEPPKPGHTPEPPRPTRSLLPHHRPPRDQRLRPLPRARLQTHRQLALAPRRPRPADPRRRPPPEHQRGRRPPPHIPTGAFAPDRTRTCRDDVAQCIGAGRAAA